MQHHGVDYLGVAFVNEGVELRQAGIRLPIIVLDPMKTALHHLIKYQLTRSLLVPISRNDDRRGAATWVERVSDSHQTRYGNAPRWLRGDRFTKTVADVAQPIGTESGFDIFAFTAADEPSPEMDAFTLQQIALFRQNAETLERGLGYQVIKHTLNTAGIERFSEYQFDMARLGIGLWGMNCVNEEKLRNVCSLSTRIMQLKTVKAGDTVGYNRRGKITKDAEIALLPLGYADGIDRRLGNGNATFLYKGQHIPTVGNVCMDLLMVDVTGLNAKVGDEVVIFNDEQRISVLAKLLGTIPYEVLTSISPRVRRVYFRE